MRTNCSSLIQGHNVCLVPYRKEHVEKYHEWMKSEELQQLTASEPLSLQEEYDMQQSWLNDKNKAMCGDVNLFFDEEVANSAEVEVMIAEQLCRGQGFGQEALMAMLRYGVEHLNLNQITAKIGMDNTPSMRLFMKLGFEEVSHSDVFKEVTFKLEFTESRKNWLTEETRHLVFLETFPAS